ncbi:hypothetical protein ACFPWS_14550 [Streptomyces aureus]|uniref:hypothetical protein n=1 Tax=Streptomyces aureus TaxID=193461 RepID=UPI0031DA0FFA
MKYIAGRRPDGSRLCKWCHMYDPVTLRTCRSCGAIEHLFHYGLCNACALPESLRRC